MNIKELTLNDLEKLKESVILEIENRNKNGVLSKEEKKKQFREDPNFDSMKKECIKFYDSIEIEVPIKTTTTIIAQVFPLGDIRGQYKLISDEIELLISGDEIVDESFTVDESYLNMPAVKKEIENTKNELEKELQRTGLRCRVRDMAEAYELEVEDIWDALS